jgi:hypothetical protein
MYNKAADAALAGAKSCPGFYFFGGRCNITIDNNDVIMYITFEKRKKQSLAAAIRAMRRQW